MIRRRALLAVGFALCAGMATSVSAQTYPDKPIKMIVPFPPGGPIDTMARLTGQSMSASLGKQPHLLSTLFKTQAGLDITYIPYKGSASSVNDLLGGQTHFTIDGMLILIPQVKAGKLRALAVARPERWPDLPDVPTLVESGYPDFIIDAWTGVMAPKGTPPQIVARLNAVINDGLKTEEIKTAL